MSLLSEFIGDGLADLQADLGGPMFTWASAQIPCVVSTLKRGTVLEAGGMAAEVAMTFIVRQADIVDIAGGPPTAGKVVTHGGASYRVLSVGKTAGGASYEFDVGNPNR